MKNKFINRIGLAGVVACALTAALPMAGHAALQPLPIQLGYTVAPGWDLFQTDPSSCFNFGGNNVFFQGVPLETFDFGGALGVKGTGKTDTIIQRLGPATVPALGDTATINTQVDALQLRSTAPTNAFGGPVKYAYVTLQSDRSAAEVTQYGAGLASGGTLSITFDSASSGTFNSTLNINIDIRSGSLNGPIIAPGLDLSLFSQTDNPWENTPPSSGSVLINGVNSFLDGNNNLEDFFPNPFIEGVELGNGDFAHHVVDAAKTPEPSSMVFFAIGLLFLAAAIGRRAVKS